MATTWGKPSLSMVARAAFLRSLKNSACSSGLSWICCRRLVAIAVSLLSRDGQMHRQEAPGLVEALLRRVLGIAGVRAHGEAVASALVECERADLAERLHPRLHPTHVRDRTARRRAERAPAGRRSRGRRRSRGSRGAPGPP